MEVFGYLHSVEEGHVVVKDATKSRDIVTVGQKRKEGPRVEGHVFLHTVILPFSGNI